MHLLNILQSIPRFALCSSISVQAAPLGRNRLHFDFRAFLHNFCRFLSWIDARKINLQSTNTEVPLWSQSTTASVERSFSVLNKLLAKDKNFLPQNVKHYMCVHYNLSTR